MFITKMAKESSSSFFLNCKPLEERDESYGQPLHTNADFMPALYPCRNPCVIG
jgi:hypothetical protein